MTIDRERIDTPHSHGKNMPMNRKKELTKSIISVLAPRDEMRDDTTHPNTAHRYGQSVKMATKSGFGAGGRCLALGNLVVITQLATKSSAMFRKANARTPHANPAEPFRRLFSMIGYTTPPTEVPLLDGEHDSRDCVDGRIVRAYRGM